MRCQMEASCSGVAAHCGGKAERRGSDMKLEWKPVAMLVEAQFALVQADKGRVLACIYKSNGSVYLHTCYYVWGEFTSLHELVVEMKEQAEQHLSYLSPRVNSQSKKETITAIQHFDAWLVAHQPSEGRYARGSAEDGAEMQARQEGEANNE